jgi:hypothetical protein
VHPLGLPLKPGISAGSIAGGNCLVCTEVIRRNPEASVLRATIQDAVYESLIYADLPGLVGARAGNLTVNCGTAST